MASSYDLFLNNYRNTLNGSMNVTNEFVTYLLHRINMYYCYNHLMNLPTADRCDMILSILKSVNSNVALHTLLDSLTYTDQLDMANLVSNYIMCQKKRSLR